MLIYSLHLFIVPNWYFCFLESICQKRLSGPMWGGGGKEQVKLPYIHSKNPVCEGVNPLACAIKLLTVSIYGFLK
jgi:hypothetical protein